MATVWTRRVAVLGWVVLAAPVPACGGGTGDPRQTAGGDEDASMAADTGRAPIDAVAGASGASGGTGATGGAGQGVGSSEDPSDGMADTGIADAGAQMSDAAQPDPVDAGDGSPSRFDAMRLGDLPIYLGSRDNGLDCATPYQLAGHTPTAPGSGTYPLFLYFGGTEFIPGHFANLHDNAAAMTITEAMARRGFVALSVDYDDSALAWLSDHENQLSCLFEPTRDTGVLAVACALPQVDCDLGIAAWGYSQGGLVAVRAHDFDARVRAVWTTGYGGDGAATLPPERGRFVNGESDPNGSKAVMDVVAGIAPDRCASDVDHCLRDDGSGWILVRQADLADPTREAGHCWFDRQSCGAGELSLEPNWTDAESTKVFALEPNADWLAATARRP